jgi:hypothetical protein
MAYDDLKDPAYAQTRVKSSGKSNGRSGSAAPKTYNVPNLINEGNYNVGKPAKSQVSGGRAAGWRPRASNSSQTPEGQNVKYQAPKPASSGLASVKELPGQYTTMPKSGGK